PLPVITVQESRENKRAVARITLKNRIDIVGSF
ncbi:MAG: hypothetical protein ACJATE_000709, partial [Bacteroidia bacterium]